MEDSSVPDGVERPLAGIRVVDLIHGPLAPATRYLAELGASVARIEPEAPVADRYADLAANAGKQRHHIAPDSDAARALIAAADIVVADAAQSLDLQALADARPELVVMRVSDFGSDTGISDWQGAGPVLHALSGELARSGIRGRAPLLPPGDLAYQCAASQAAYTLVTALFRALRTGKGDLIDFSALDGAVQALDPGYGISGSATMGKPANLLSRDRPSQGFQYPVLKCADGHVRICLLSKRQWQGMFRWMGEPPEFADPRLNNMVARYKSPDLLPAIARFFAGRTREDLEREGQEHGVPISAVLTFEESIATSHVRERHGVTQVPIEGDRSVTLPNGVVTIDGRRMGLDLAPRQASATAFPGPSRPDAERPFAGLKVLDMGVIVVGAETGRLLGDQGADVVKVESRAYPDGNRQSYLSYGMSVSFAAGHRNKRSLGINLRDPEGRAVFLKLAAQADVILSNFKPGALENLGLSYAEIAAVNPAIVMTDSSAFGSSGPWSNRMGYGPLVRAATGLTLAWRYPDDPEGFSDTITIYPDHVAARIGAIATVALLIRRLRTGRGGTASVAQSEVMLAHFAADVARVSDGLAPQRAPDWPWTAYPAQGEDEWCAVAIRDDNDWMALCDRIGWDEGRALKGAQARLAAADRIDAAVAPWIAQRSPSDAAQSLQSARVPAAPMLRLADLPGFSYYRERGFYRVEQHPYLNEDVTSEAAHTRSRNLDDALRRPAPMAGEHSHDVVAEWLDLPEAAVAELFERGILEAIDPAELKAVEEERARHNAVLS
ncbi:CaiB/BaiF CoA-transferase family protein [Sphingosinithalassobacter portus]|uniref:CaiB/BaiF CoA-transferase family protein n=1 Tax=Stakelama portus TaxID=2676234 RepID=UPI000D6E8C6E|nr:CoA transferase [Sphingosinithalassobacter portus]